jgi:hypothetical protein
MTTQESDNKSMEVGKGKLSQEHLEGSSPQDFLNISKLYILVLHKYAVSTLLSQFFRYLFFILFFAVIILMQKNASYSSEMSSAINNIMMYDVYRDAGTYELLGWADIFDFGNFWDWHRGPFLKNFYVEDYVSGRPAAAMDQQRIQTHIKFIGGFRIVQRRAKNGTCSVIPRFAAFDATCYGATFLQGTQGSVDRSDFVGANNLSTYKFQEYPSSYLYKEEGFYQARPHRLSRPSPPCCTAPSPGRTAQAHAAANAQEPQGGEPRGLSEVGRGPSAPPSCAGGREGRDGARV